MVKTMFLLEETVHTCILFMIYKVFLFQYCKLLSIAVSFMSLLALSMLQTPYHPENSSGSMGMAGGLNAGSLGAVPRGHSLLFATPGSSQGMVSSRRKLQQWELYPFLPWAGAASHLLINPFRFCS